MLEFSDYISDVPDIPHENFAQLLEQVSKDYAEKDAVLYRSGKQKEFTRWTYSRFGDECRKVARGLLAAGLKKGDRVVLWAENRPEWLAVWMGTVIAGICIVPVDYLISEQECLNIINITKAKALFYSVQKKDFALSLFDRGIDLSVLVCISRQIEFDGFGADGGNTPLPDTILPHDTASIVFTSGTSGFAKGVMLSHKNIIANASAAMRILQPAGKDSALAALPLHHTYPTTCTFITPVSIGASVVITEKIIGKVIVNDIRDAGVSFLVAVPLLLDKMMLALETGYNKLPKIIRGALNLLRKIALKKAKKGRPEFGQKVFRFVRKKAGLQSVRVVVSGGSHLNSKTADFFDSLGFNIVHGYGITENSPLVTVNATRHKRNESVGLPISYTDVQILKPGTDGIGEIAVKSPSVMLGYFENGEASKAAINENGYLLTGDLGCRDKDGFLYIKGRRKNIIISSNGKNIYPEEIEALFDNSRAVGEILVIGRKEPNRRGEQIFAVVVPNYAFINEDHADRKNDDRFINELIRKTIEDINRSLPIYKKINDFLVRKEPFVKNGQQKIKRFLYKQYETDSV